ncbi:hypothetical protein [Metabacillus litoralis]|jgi:hypothetical protein|uniref:hypothetical protein n=1 Tax=Metabacillus litoralis TaxID=152268 RepID=UPI00203E8DBE|nr:hypothetical protein [Metabacillus litoralis]MCM3651738.1 hypothetical protein [Metabacillus litoralis]
MKSEHFDIKTLKLISNKLDYINSIAKGYYNDNPELMDTIENLARVANMFATSKIQELNGHTKTTNPQGFILSTLATPYSRMKEYEKQKNNEFPPWEL